MSGGRRAELRVPVLSPAQHLVTSRGRGQAFDERETLTLEARKQEKEGKGAGKTGSGARHSRYNRKGLATEC